jgi:hypothetical protein
VFFPFFSDAWECVQFFQSTITQRIFKLEKTMGRQLPFLVKDGRGMHDPGQLLLARAYASQQQREHSAAIARSGRGDGGDPMLRGGKRF